MLENKLHLLWLKLLRPKDKVNQYFPLDPYPAIHPQTTLRPLHRQKLPRRHLLAHYRNKHPLHSNPYPTRYLLNLRLEQPRWNSLQRKNKW
ncbi:hypothetical protein BKA69DRAFT_1088542 [Paraphysoderma sedebokerense]|nr:hypothetical protein BKA69DRAFT_1088542 [Paraphysoderma sedebokerense]